MRRLIAPALALGVLVGCNEATGPAPEICDPSISGYQLAVGDTMTLQQDSRVRYIDVVVGTGPKVVQNTVVDVDYVGYVRQSTCRFDAGSLVFNAGSGTYIQGFKVGVLGMKEGGVRRLLIPTEAGYVPGTSHPLSGLDLIFDVQVVTAR